MQAERGTTHGAWACVRRRARRMSLAILLAMMGCSGSGADPAESPGDPVDSEATSPANTSSWFLNDTVRSTEIFETSAREKGVLEEIQLVEGRDVDGVLYALVRTSNVPGYTVEMTQELIDGLNTRPRASTDFTAGATTARAGQIVVFGEDIGYVSSTVNCNDTGEYGYWPPGPNCPLDQDFEAYITTDPKPNDEDCGTGLGRVGLYVDGANIFNWDDGTADADTWHNLAPEQEVYDLDVCAGHSNRPSEYRRGACAPLRERQEDPAAVRAERTPARRALSSGDQPDLGQPQQPCPHALDSGRPADPGHVVRRSGPRRQGGPSFRELSRGAQPRRPRRGVQPRRFDARYCRQPPYSVMSRPR